VTALATLADEFEALAAEVEARLAASAVCEAVISHPSTPPKTAGRVFLLARWLNEYPLATIGGGAS
jgi:hypothetical protein